MVISYVRGRLAGLLRLLDFQDKIDKLLSQELVLNSFNIFNCLFVERKYIYIYSVIILSNFFSWYYNRLFSEWICWMMKRYKEKT